MAGNELRCQHLTTGRSSSPITLQEGERLLLCPTCLSLVRLAIMQELIGAALEAAFQTTVDEALKQ